MSRVDEEHFEVSVEVAVSDQFFGWVIALGDVLDIREAANYDLEGIDDEIRNCDTPGEMRELVRERKRV